MNDLRLEPLVNDCLFIVITPHTKFLAPLFPLALELYWVFSMILLCYDVSKS